MTDPDGDLNSAEIDAADYLFSDVSDFLDFEAEDHIVVVIPEVEAEHSDDNLPEP